MTVPAAISVDGLVVERGARRVLDGITFDVAPGEIVGLLGPNGAGKTTTLAVLSTLLRPGAGQARIAGHDLVADPRGVRGSIGRVPQEIAVYPSMTARENARFFARLKGLGRAAAKRTADEALELVGLSIRADDLASTYSGGMQRRLNLACGLLGSPPVLLLDEPTVGVDPQSLARIVRAIRRQASSGTALLYSTHHMEEVEQLCDRVVLIDAGRVIAAGTPKGLVQRFDPGLRIDVVMERPLPADWLAGLEGACEVGGAEPGAARAIGGREPGAADEVGGAETGAAHEIGAVQTAAPPAGPDGSAMGICVMIESFELAASVLERARAAGGNVIDFHVHRPSLHDVFLSLTGHALRD